MPVHAFAAPDRAAPLSGRARTQTSTATYWKCQIGRRIQMARQAKAGLGVAQRFGREGFARQVGILPARLWEIENGLLAIEGPEIAMIAEALGLHPGGLFDDRPLDIWSATARNTPSWMLAGTIGALAPRDRNLLEEIVLRLSAA